MGRIFTLTTDMRQLATDAFDDLLDQLAKPCRLIYTSGQLLCPNCVIDTSNGRSANVFNGTGSAPFDDFSLCPVCYGAGVIGENATEVVNFSIAMDPTSFWVKPPKNFQVPAGSIQTKFYLRDLPKVLKARKMVVQTSLEAFIRWVYHLDGEPLSPGNIVQDRYVVCNWTRVGG